MDQLSKAIVEMQNRVRQTPYSFIPKLRQRLDCFEGKLFLQKDKPPLLTREGVSAVKEAVSYLEKLQSLQQLTLSEGMAKACMDHANDIGTSGAFSHTGSDGSSASQRLERYGMTKGKVGENIEFGTDDPEEIVVRLLIDDGNQGRGQRRNLLNPDFKMVGVAVTQHSKAGVCVVINYAAEFLENNRSQPLYFMENASLNRPSNAITSSNLGEKSRKEMINVQNFISEVWRIQNFLRKFPKKFIPKLEARLQYFEGKKYCFPGATPVVTHEGPIAVKEAISYLEEQLPLDELLLSEEVRKAAQDHADDLGFTGLTSHTGSDGSTMSQRIGKYGKWGGQIGENINFGINEPEEAIIDLLIDDGNPSRGHRKNLFNPKFRISGIGAQLHKTLEICVVIDYATEFISKQEMLKNASGEKENKPLFRNLDCSLLTTNSILFDASPTNASTDRRPYRSLSALSESQVLSTRFDFDCLAREVFEAQNRLRRDPKSFIPLVEAKLSQITSDGNQLKITEGPSAVYEVIDFLQTCGPREQLQWKDSISKACRDHANDIGPKGTYSQIGSDGSNLGVRLERHGKWEGQIAENMSFGPFDANEIIVSLLIDDGNPSRVQRKNMLNPDFRKAGVAACKHANMNVCVVMVYATEFSERGVGGNTVNELAQSQVVFQTSSLSKLAETDNSPLNGSRVLSFSKQESTSSASKTKTADQLAEEVIQAQNKLRRSPASFIPKLEAKLSCFKENTLFFPGQTPIVTKEGPQAVLEAIEVLKKQLPVPFLEVGEGMKRACIDHAKDIGTKGICSHDGSDGSSIAIRLERYGRWSGQIGESIDYGSLTADDVIYNLLVDDGNPKRGHRANLLNPHYRFVGCASYPHPSLGMCIVINYATEYTNAVEKNGRPCLKFNRNGLARNIEINTSFDSLLSQPINASASLISFPEETKVNAPVLLDSAPETNVYKKLSAQVFDLQNKLRQNPSSFIPILENHLKYFNGLELQLPDQPRIVTVEGPSAVIEAIEALKQTAPLPTISWTPEIAKACQDHATDIGLQGAYSHEGSDGSNLEERLNRYGNWQGIIGENLDFGSFEPANIIASMLIDDGSVKRGHRKNLLNPEFRVGAVAAARHKENMVCLVLNYASEYIGQGRTSTRVGRDTLLTESSRSLSKTQPVLETIRSITPTKQQDNFNERKTPESNRHSAATPTGRRSTLSPINVNLANYFAFFDKPRSISPSQTSESTTTQLELDQLRFRSVTPNHARERIVAPPKLFSSNQKPLTEVSPLSLKLSVSAKNLKVLPADNIPKYFIRRDQMKSKEGSRSQSPNSPQPAQYGSLPKNSEGGRTPQGRVVPTISFQLERTPVIESRNNSAFSRTIDLSGNSAEKSQQYTYNARQPIPSAYVNPFSDSNQLSPKEGSQKSFQKLPFQFQPLSTPSSKNTTQLAESQAKTYSCPQNKSQIREKSPTLESRMETVTTPKATYTLYKPSYVPSPRVLSNTTTQEVSQKETPIQKSTEVNRQGQSNLMGSTQKYAFQFTSRDKSPQSQLRVAAPSQNPQNLRLQNSLSQK